MSTSLIGSTSALFVVRLSAPVTEKVTVAWQTEDGTGHAGIDYEAGAGTVEFAPGETEKGIEVVVLGREDGSTGNGLTFYVRLRPPVNAVLLDELSECRISVETDEGVVTTSLVVATGPHGKKGDPGLSAYELAKVQGYEGSLTDWLGGAGVQAVVMASQAAAQAKEQLNRAFRFEPGNKVPELPPIEQMEGKIVVVRNGAPVGMEASNDTALGLAVNLGKNNGSSMVGHTDKADGKTKTVGQTLDRLADEDAALKKTAQDRQDALNGAMGFSQIGQVASWAALATVVPTKADQQVILRGWNAGSTHGGGIFKAVAGAATSDGGTVCPVNGQWYWKRVQEDALLTIYDFGAVVDGKTDDMPAVKAMFEATRKNAVANPVGIRLPAGVIALSGTLDLSGSTEQPMFRLKAPDVEFGVVPVTKIVPLDKTSTVPLFQLNARRLEVTGIHIDTTTDNVKPFLKNVCPRGEYVRVKSFRVNNSAGLTFDLVDTIDTKFEQVYCYSISGGFIRTSWSNLDPGGWNHPTAIEISNANFSSSKKVEPIRAIRAGQSIMRNVWFSNNEYTFDISQGGWLFDTVIMENSTYPAKVKYAKIFKTNCRFEQGATLDEEGTDFDPSWDQGKPLPTWVTNAMDQGGVDLRITGSRFNCGVSTQFDFSDTILTNTTNAEKWVEVGRVILQDRGRTAHMRLLGTSGWNSAAGEMKVPAGTGFGGGEANIFIESKEPTTESTGIIEVHWHGEGASPIQDVKYVRAYSTVTIYVKMAAYCLSAALFIDSNGVSRAQSGRPFYTRLTNVDVADINAIPNLKQASARWAINKGVYNDNGLGMDLDSGDLLLYTKKKMSKGAADYVPVMLNGEPFNIQVVDKFAVRVPYYVFDELPSPSDYVYCQVLCSNTAKSPSMQMLYSNGYRWIYVAYPTERVTKIADGSPIINN
ncbi:putative EPS depolymerase [Erwinia phage Stean]|nr:putative EPS depolymerase [Erwinia phage Stean]